MISVALILITMVFGSLSIAFVLPHDQIHLVDGIMQAFSDFFTVYHLKWLIPVITVMVLIGSLGGIINWIISPAKGLLQAAKDGYLPQFFQKENKNEVAANLLITQAILVSIVCLVFLLMPSVNGSYWLLTDLSTQLYMLMYVIMFLAAIALSCAKLKAKFKIFGGKIGLWFICILGLIGCAITLVVGFFPPGGIDVGGITHYEIMFGGGIAVMILPVFAFFFYKGAVA
jgi:amino acid transporter